METEFGGNRKVALILSWQRGEHSRLMPQELCPSSRGSLGDYIDEGSKFWVGDEEQMCKDLVFFLLYCFEHSHMLVSGSPGRWVHCLLFIAPRLSF